MALGLAALAAACATHASAQSLFQPTPQDPANARFSRPADTATTRGRAIATAGPVSAGSTGFDSTGSIRKQKKRRPGERHLGRSTPAPAPGARTTTLPPPGPPQAADGHGSAPQIAARASYADVYKPPDAPRRRPLPPVQDPFEPAGIRAGGFLLRPALEVTRGHDSNADRVPNGRASGYTVIAPELTARSEWARHELAASLRGSYSKYDDIPFLDRPYVDAKVNGRIDATRDTRIDLEGRYLMSTDNPGSPNLQADLAELPIFSTVGGTAGVTQRFNHLELMGKANIDRTSYRESKLTDGSTFSNHDRDYNQYGGALRGSYEIKPGVKPFIEVAADRRVHDLNADRNGFQRNSQAFVPRAGTTFEMNRLLTGEFSIGYLTRRYEDPRLAELSGIVADASLIWLPNGLTALTLTASSRAEESVVAGVSGALKRDIGLQLDHAFRRWLIGTLKFGYGNDDYVGLSRTDRRGAISGGLTYKFNRELWFKGEARQEWLRSNVSGVDYDATVFTLGVRLQR
jgi:hypothetical protein